MQRIALTAWIVLIGCVLYWRLSHRIDAPQALAAATLLAPLLLPLPGLLRGTRRTYAWATLCLLPCLVAGMTEAIVNPAARGWAGVCLALALAAFAALIGFLRATGGSATRAAQ
jgi:uncharacterized membrane protein